MTSLISKKRFLKHEPKIQLQYKRKGSENSKMKPKMLAMRKDAKKQSEKKRNEAKISFICFAN
jgi:hypothetical protein